MLCSQKANDRGDPDPKSTINESPQSEVMWVLIVFVATLLLIMTINLGGVVQMCPKIVGDTNVTVVADVTVGCYRLYLYSTIDEIVARRSTSS
jgi:hypothetical protein